MLIYSAHQENVWPRLAWWSFKNDLDWPKNAIEQFLRLLETKYFSKFVAMEACSQTCKSHKSLSCSHFSPSSWPWIYWKSVHSFHLEINSHRLQLSEKYHVRFDLFDHEIQTQIYEPFYSWVIFYSYLSTKNHKSSVLFSDFRLIVFSLRFVAD